jgi:hypothetical protein
MEGDGEVIARVRGVVLGGGGVETRCGSKEMETRRNSGREDQVWGRTVLTMSVRRGDSARHRREILVGEGGGGQLVVSGGGGGRRRGFWTEHAGAGGEERRRRK